ncbi:MAG: PLxRFG domain-containing protein [Desulfuromonadales bacterium]
MFIRMPAAKDSWGNDMELKPFNGTLDNTSSLVPFTGQLDGEVYTPRGIIPEIVNQGMAGVVVDTPRMIGKGMQYLSTPGNALYDKGKSLVDSAEERGKTPLWAPTTTSETTAGKFLAKGARQIGPSIIPAAAFTAGVALAPEAVIPATVAGIIGAGLGAVPAGLSQGQETFEKGLKKYGLTEEQAAQLPADPRVTEAKKASRINAGIEWGGETIGGALAGRMVGAGGKMLGVAGERLLGKTGATAGESVLKNITNPQAVKNYFASVVETALEETATEMGQGAAEAAVEKHYGYDNESPWNAATSAIAPTIGMTFLVSLAGIPGRAKHSMQQRQLVQALSDPSVDPSVRSEAAQAVYAGLAKVDPSAANNFKDHAINAIGDVAETGTAPYKLDLSNPNILQQFDASQVEEANAVNQQNQPAPEIITGADARTGNLLQDTSNAGSDSIPESWPVDSGRDLGIAATPPTGAMTRAVNSILPDLPPVSADMYSSFAAQPFANAPEIQPEAASLPSAPSELEKAMAWRKQQSSGHLMQLHGERDASYASRIISEYRKSQGEANGITSILPEVQGAGPRQMDGQRVAVPELQSQVAGVGSDNIQPGGMSKSGGISALDMGASGNASQFVGGNASSVKGTGQSSRSDIKSLGDFFKSKTFLEQGLGVLDIKAQTGVVVAMVNASHDPQILDAVVKAFPVDVVDNLSRQQLTPKEILHNPAMLEKHLTSNGSSAISIPGYLSDAFAKASASIGTNRSAELTTGQTAGGSTEGSSTDRTNNDRHNNTSNNNGNNLRQKVGQSQTQKEGNNGLQELSQEVNGSEKEMSDLRKQAVATRIAELQQEKGQLLKAGSSKGITGGLVYSAETTQRLGEINAEIQRLNKPVTKPPTKPANTRRQLDSSKDSLAVAIAKLGGISRTEIDKQTGTGKDLAHTLNSLATKEAKAGILHVISSKGIPLDRMREALVEQGYLDESADINTLLDKLDSAQRGTVHRSTHSTEAGTDAYREAEIRYSEMINAMTDGEYDEFSRNQWLDEQVQELADAGDILDEYLDGLDNETMTAADWQEVENDLKEALDATEFSQGNSTEDQGQVQEDATSEAESVSPVSKGDIASEGTATSRADGIKAVTESDIPLKLKQEYAGLPAPETPYFKKLYEAVKQLVSDKWYYNQELQYKSRELLNDDLAITETKPLQLDTSEMEYNEANKAHSEFKNKIETSPRGTWGIVTNTRKDGTVVRHAIMSNGSEKGSLGDSDAYVEDRGDRPSFNVSVDRLFEGEISRMRKIVEYEIAYKKNMEVQGSTQLRVGMVIKDVAFPGDKPFSSMTITGIKDGVVSFRLTRKGTKNQWEGQKDIANLHDILDKQDKLPKQVDPFKEVDAAAESSTPTVDPWLSAGQVETNPDSESAAAINSRSDNNQWPHILQGLRDGGTLKKVSGLQRYVLDGLDESHASNGVTISPSRVSRLEKSGVLSLVGVERYSLGKLPQEKATAEQKTKTPVKDEKPTAARYEAGTELSKEERKQVLSTLTDVYRSNNVQKEERTDSRGEPYLAYPHTPDVFVKSDITGKMLRHYVTLPDGKIAHPTELFPEMTQADVDKALSKQDRAEEQQRMDDKWKDEVFSNRERSADKAAATRSYRVRLGKNVSDFNVVQKEIDRAVMTTDGKEFVMVSPEFVAAAERAGFSKAEAEPESAQNNDEQKPATAKTKVTDAGEELTYNKRNRVKSGLKWADVQDKNDALKAKEIQKSNIYPKPDYEALVADGMQPIVAHIVKQVYDSISVKPDVRGIPSDADFQTYITAVNRVMDGVFKWSKDKDAVLKWAGKQQSTAGAMLGQRVSLSDLTEVSSLYEMVYPGGWREFNKEVSIVGSNKVLKALQPGYDQVKRAIKDIGVGWPSQVESWQKQGFKIVPTEGFAIEEVGDSVYVRKSTGTGRYNYVDAAHFYSQEEAQTFLDGMKPFTLFNKRGRMMESFETEEQAKEAARTAVKKEGNSAAVEDRGVNVTDAERTGPEHREEGEDVTAERLMDVIGFKGVNFGNWVPNDERQMHLNHAYDSFLDLAAVLNVPPRALSLNGMLGLAIGAQGSGKYAAHFVPGVNEINITRTAGAGSVAHEWAHSLDHYFATKAGFAASSSPWMTVLKRNGENGDVRPEIVKAFGDIVQAMTKRQATPEELANRQKSLEESTRKNLESWLKYFEKEFSGLEQAAAEFAVLADKIRKGDYQRGEGAYVTIIKGTGRNLGTAVLSISADVRDLAKKWKIRIPTDNIKALDHNISFMKHLEEKKDSDHTPQMAITTYQSAANKLDGDKKTRYWSTPLEMFARAFDAYVVDKLAAQEQSNTYLAHLNRSPETVPMGEERKTINAAFDVLVNSLETKQTDNGIALLSRSAGSVKTTTPISTKDADGVISHFLKSSRLDSKVKINLRDSFAALPDEVRKAAEDAGGNENNTYAVLHKDGSAWIIRDAHETREELEKSIFHEVVGHLGIFRLFGLHSIQQLNRLFNKIGGINELAKLADKYNVRDRFDKYWKDAQTEQRKGMQHARITAELIAMIGERSPSLMQKAKEAWGAIRQALRRMGFPGLSQYNDSDLAYLLSEGKKSLQKSGKGGAFTVLMTAWHGSPHDHDGFSTDKIGTGEGAQAYGYGLYFAGSKDVAEWYRTKLSGRKWVLDTPNGTTMSLGDWMQMMFPESMLEKELGTVFNSLSQAVFHFISSNTGNIQDAIKTVSQIRGQQRYASYNWNFYADVQRVLQSIADQGTNFRNQAGKLYQVELSPKEEEYLQWDKPLSEQSEVIKKAVADQVPEHKIDRYGSLRYGDKMIQSDEQKELTGRDLYMLFKMKTGSEKAASEYLHSIGIRGIKYLDGNSRNRFTHVPITAERRKEITERANQIDKVEIPAAKNAATLKELHDERATISKELAQADAKPQDSNYVIFNDADVEIQAKFKLTDTPSTGIQVTEAQTWVSTLPIAKRVNVVQSISDLPENAQTEITKAQVNPAHVQAMELHGTIHVITDNVPDLQRVKALVIGHELAHAGQTKKVVDLAVDWFKRTVNGKTEAAKEAHLMLDRIANRYGYDLTDEKQYRRAVQEATAAIAEQAVNADWKPSGLMQRLFMYIKHWLRQQGLISHVSDSELSLAVAEMLRIGEKRLSVGKGGDEAMFAAAWHGSPHDHNGFSTEYIDTGEGNQAYGYGMYFAGSKDVAEFYRDTLSKGNALSMAELENYFQPGRIVPSYGGQDRVVSFNPGNDLGGWTVTIHHVDKNGEKVYGPDGKNRTHYTMPSAKDYEKVTGEKPKLGNLYQVELAPKEDEYLLWDKSLSEQSEKVKEAIKDAFDDITNRETDYHKASELSRHYQNMLDKEDKASGAYIYKNFTIDMGEQATSEYLHSLGIRGIKYLDGSSRSKGDGNFNYVIFNDADVKITAKFSLQDQAISRHAAKINAPAKVTDMVKSLIEMAGQSIPERLKANIGKILSNPWFGSEGKPIRRHVVNLNLERSQNRNGIISDLFQASEGYTGVEGLDNILKKASKEELKQFNDLIKHGDENGVATYFTRDELYRGKTKFGKVGKTVVEAYRAFHEVMNAANRVRFQQLDELSMLPYKDQEWFADLVELLNKNMERSAHLDAKEASEVHRLIRSLKRNLTDEELASGENPAKIKASPAVIAAYRDFWKQVDQTEKKHQGNMLSAFRDILGYRGELDKLKSEWGNLRGYAPRNRKDGDWHVSVYTTNDEGERVKVYMKPTLTETGAKGLVKEVQADLKKHLKGNFEAGTKYEVEYERNNATPSELLAWKGSEVAVEALLNQAFDRAGVTGKMSVEQWQSLKHEVFQEIAKEIMAQGFGRHGISREANMIEGYDDADYQTVLKEYISGMSGWLSKMRFAIEATSAAKDISKANPSDKVWVNDYVQDAMKNSTYLDELAATARSVGAVYYLGFKVSSALLNAFQNYTVGQAELSLMMKKAGHKGSGIAALAKAQKDVMADFINVKSGGTGTLTKEEHDVLFRAVREGTAQAQAIRQISGTQEMGFGTGWKKFTELSMTPFQFVEQRLNREPAILAAYRIFKKSAAGTVDEAAYKKAEEFVNNTHYVMGKENLPEMVRKLGPLGKTAYLFQGYVHNYMHWMFNRAKDGEFATIARSLGAIAALGGVFALPGADDMDNWIMKWFGVSYKMKFKKFVKDAAGNSTPGQIIQNFVNHGVTSVAGVDMSRALAVNIPFISDPEKTFGERIGGAWGGLLKKPGMALNALQKGDGLRAIENIVPEFAANPMRAARQYNQGATTLGGKPVFDETGHQVKYTGTDVAKKMLGFNPLEISDRTNLKSDERDLNAYWKSERDDALAGIRRAKNSEDMKAAVRGVVKYNTELRKSQAFGLVPIIKAESIQKSRTFKPQKKTMAWERNQIE